MQKITTILTGMLFCSVPLLAQDAELLNINSKETEFSPSLSAEGNYLIFQSNKDASDLNEDAEWKLYTSVKGDDNAWSHPVQVDSINNNVAFVAGPNLSYDGNTLYFTAFIEGASESEDIFYSRRTGDSWGSPKNIGSPINTAEMFEGFPSVSSDENAIYFIRVNEDNPWDRKNKENCFTIFVSQKGKDGNWQEPVALPEPINMGCERSPRIMADNKTLIFSSIRDGGKGSYDLYQSTLIGDNEWSEPIALDFINTKDSDLSPSIPASGDVVYYNASGDIVKAEVPDNFRQAINLTINGQLKDKIRGKGLNGAIEVYNAANDELISTLSTNAGTGDYSLVLQSGNSYNLIFKAENYEEHRVDYDLSDVKQYEERSLHVELEQFYTLDLSIKDAEIESTFPSTLKVVNAENEEELQVIDSAVNKASLKLAGGLNYNIITGAKHYSDDTLRLDLSGKLKNLSGTETISLKPKKVPVSIALGNFNNKNSRKIRVQNERTGEVIEADANEVLLLRSGDRYKVIVNSEKGYAFASDDIDLTQYGLEDDDDSSTSTDGQLLASASEDSPVPGLEIPEIKVEIPMVELKKGTHITMEQILFATNSAEIDQSSFTELDQLVDMLEKNEDLKIEIAAHTDDVGSDAANLNLSQLRAQSVADYLFSKGVAKNRYLVRGYGESSPRVPNDSPENRAKNRRVEFIVTE